MSIPIFVYGSLRKGLFNNYLLMNSVYNGIWYTCEKYYMIGLKSDAFPYVCKYPAFETMPTNIVGELYHIDQSLLERLDILEGHPVHYKRIKIEICNGDKTIESFIYMLDNESDIDDIKRNPCRFVTVSGDWVEYLNNKNK